jgi:hypothetical protein
MATGWFSDAHASREQADLVFTVHPRVRQPYSTKPTHSPFLMLVSLAIPLWWKESCGLTLDVESPTRKITSTVSTRREGTVVLWGLSPLLNLASDRALVDHGVRDAQHVRVKLLPLLTGS